MTSSSTVTVRSFGAVDTAARAWRFRGRQFVTAVVKASFEIVPDGAMRSAPPRAVLHEDRYRGRGPLASLERASDVALHVPKPEVVVDAVAFAPPGQRLTTMTARLVVQRESKPLFNKPINVFGDRRAPPRTAPPEPQPFESMPIVYERAYGGPSHRANPVGVGSDVDASGLLTLPNIESARDPNASAGFGAIAPSWPSRRELLAAPIDFSRDDCVLPDTFDMAYFQTAPADQQVKELHGVELIAMFGLHPHFETLRTYLPGARGVAVGQTTLGHRVSIPLRLETVHLEPHRLRAELVFRGAISVPGEQLAGLRIGGALERPSEPFVFPDLMSAEDPHPHDTQLSHRAPRGGTMIIEAKAETNSRAGQVTRERTETLVIETSSPAPSQPRAREQTLVVEVDHAPVSLPFEGRAKGAPRGKPSLSATPWASEPTKPKPIPIGDDPLMSTISLGGEDEPTDEDTASAPPQPVAFVPGAPPPAVVVAPHPPASTPVSPASKRAKVQWREDPPAKSTKPAAPAAKPEVARANFKADLYKKKKP
ncbi:MAG: DUF2169 domain-containing protein [Polyangiaceae bacterium]|nr:DUF2169 domain-containing protein [Polyangiaceae bacterium]